MSNYLPPTFVGEGEFFSSPSRFHYEEENGIRWMERKPKRRKGKKSLRSTILVAEATVRADQIFEQSISFSKLSCLKVKSCDRVGWLVFTSSLLFAHVHGEAQNSLASRRSRRFKFTVNWWDYLRCKNLIHMLTCVTCWFADMRDKKRQFESAGWCHSRTKGKDNYKAHLSSICATV